MTIRILEDEEIKCLRSEAYNYNFNKKTGLFVRWGKTIEDDPHWGWPEIADIEVTTKCNGAGGKLCKFCYKSNGPQGDNMSFETFKKIFHRLPRSLSQIAYGADAQAKTNPDLFKMMEYCRNNDYQYVVPNITVADITDETADKLASVCGAVAVSRYENKDICYDSIKKLTRRGMKQVNIHIMVSKETLPMVYETLQDYQRDSRLEDLNAIVLLSLKQRGRGKCFTSLTQEEFTKLTNLALEHKIPLGFDSCSAPKFLEAVKDSENYQQYKMHTEPCESTLFSTYINTEGKFFPCSFAEGIGEWEEGIDVVDCEDFLNDVWFHDKTVRFREKLLNTVDNNKLGCRECPLFEV